MKERPILFSGEMVRAILEGRKTQTRRVMKTPEHYGCPTGDCPHNYQRHCDAAMNSPAMLANCPYGRPGDRLWVRECWAYAAGSAPEERLIEYRATCEDPAGWPARRGNYADYCVWKPSIHMPRWASRISLEIVSVRAQPLQNISTADAQAEGPPAVYSSHGVYPGSGAARVQVQCDAITAFRELWDSINAKRGLGWKTNPYVWVIEFKKLQ